MRTAPPLKVPSPGSAPCELAHTSSIRWSTDTCQVLLGDSEVEEEDQVLSSKNSRNLQTEEMTSATLLNVEMRRRW